MDNLQPEICNGAPVVVGLGEALFDCFPDRTVLGGAPVNLAVHAQQLLSPRGGRAAVVSRVGVDDLGTRLEREVSEFGLDTRCLQHDRLHPTGQVTVAVDADGQPTYTIKEQVAWDFLEFDAAAQRLASECQAVCFGTLAQRCPESRQAIQSFLAAAPQAVRLFDVNLRQHFYNAEIVATSLRAASAVKLNEHELPVVFQLSGLLTSHAQGAEAQAFALLQEFGLDFLALTRGAQGTVLYSGQQCQEGEPVQFERAAGADTVGAGDASCAGLLYGWLLDWPLPDTANLANRMGAYVAAQPGATPRLPPEIIHGSLPNPGRPA